MKCLQWGFALTPGPTPLALVTDRRDHSRVTTTHPLRHTASSRVPTTQPRTPQDLAQTNTAAHDQPRCQPCSPSEELAIVTLLYLVPFHLCTLLFSFSAYHCPVPALYLSLCLLRLVVWSPDSCFSRYPSSSSVVRPYCTRLARLPGCIASRPALCI